MEKQTFVQKKTGDILTSTEWNNFTDYVNNIVDEVNEGGSGTGNSNVICTDTTESGGDPKVSVEIDTGIANLGGDTSNVKVLEFTKKTKNNNYKGTNVTLSSNNNINIEPRESVEGTKGGNISFKPGDDIEFCSHHRPASNQDEVSIKIIDGDENPVKLQLNAAEMTLTTKDKQGNNSNVFDITVNSAKNTRGYLKVRAQAIDLRCEANGGIALQPKGSDSLGHENKIKFEHDGGDGKEFGTFNTEKTSIFTSQYRFNENGRIYPSTRGALETTYKIPNDPSSGIKKIDYPTQIDDFKDIYDSDFSCTWGELVKNTIAGQKFYEDFNLNFSLVFDTYYTAGASYWPDKMTPARFNELKTLAGNTSTANIEIYTVNYLDSELFGGFRKYLSLEDIMENADYNYDEEDYASSLSPQQLQTTLNGLADNTLFAIHTDHNDVWICQKHIANPKILINGQQILISDIVTLINYFKTGAGQSSGPWAN